MHKIETDDFVVAQYGTEARRVVHYLVRVVTPLNTEDQTFTVVAYEKRESVYRARFMSDAEDVEVIDSFQIVETLGKKVIRNRSGNVTGFEVPVPYTLQ